jgi:hypothetical protein
MRLVLNKILEPFDGLELDLQGDGELIFKEMDKVLIVSTDL